MVGNTVGLVTLDFSEIRKLVIRLGMRRILIIGSVRTKSSTHMELSPVIFPQCWAMPKTLAEFETGAAERGGAIIEAVTNGGYSVKEAGDHFGLHYLRNSRIVSLAKNLTPTMFFLRVNNNFLSSNFSAPPNKISKIYVLQLSGYSAT